MAASVDRRIEANLYRDMGQRDPAGLIRPRSTEPIRACGHRPRTQAGHMTASDLTAETPEKSLRAGGHPHMSRGSTSCTRADVSKKDMDGRSSPRLSGLGFSSSESP